ncbi:coenzyme PQQ synthesis protein D (PqqD) [Haloactinopolyspora alba]|uniref:Coenzyme PQQ synthesis protein D (PqqD) n=1 Tax=Haloactinopolyspora alba TaxID=648780 RepID=A0A2P8E5J8_9ACTN|nr:coenzyme PQQ synthesis protein D (PqqD) [Haloactinopolyspora alba]
MPVAATSVRELEIDGEITLFHEPTQTALVLNTTASDVWRLIDGHRSAADIAALLASSYGADPEVVRTDVESALDTLSGHDLVATAPG